MMYQAGWTPSHARQNASLFPDDRDRPKAVVDPAPAYCVPAFWRRSEMETSLHLALGSPVTSPCLPVSFHSELSVLLHVRESLVCRWPVVSALLPTDWSRL